MKTSKAFISYSHDSLEHIERVLQLAIALHKHGVVTMLDRYVTRPPEGWPLWCQKQLEPEVSDYVLVICTATYLARLENRVPSYEGKGSYWEGSLIRQYIYDEKENRRIIPVLLPGSDDKDIPLPLRASTKYRLDAYSFECPGYDALYRELTGQPEIIKPELGELVQRPPKNAATLLIAPALPERDVKTDFQPEAGDSPTGHPSSPPSKSVQLLRWLKFSLFSAVGLSLLTALWWLRLDQPVKLAISTHPTRAFQYVYQQLHGQPGLTPSAAKIARLIQWQQQDFQDYPLSILDMLDRIKIAWTNETTGLGTTVNFVFPATNHYAFLTNLNQSAENLRLDYRLTENSDDPTLSELLRNALVLKNNSQLIDQNQRGAWLHSDYLLPFAEMLTDARRLAGAVADAPVIPTSDELLGFTTNAAHAISRVESVHILGGVNANRGWLFVCEMKTPKSALPIQVLFHSKWKPKFYYALEHGTLTRFNPDEWETEYAVIMPPSAWDEDRAWKGIK